MRVLETVDLRPQAACREVNRRPQNITSRLAATRVARLRRPGTSPTVAAESPAAEAGAPSTSGNRSPVLFLPGFLQDSTLYTDTARYLRELGHPCEVLQVERSEWYPTLAGGSFDFFLERADSHLTRMLNDHGKVSLVGHSAGGFLARILVGSKPYNGRVYARAPDVDIIVTLGAPHQSVEAYPLGRAREQRAGEDLSCIDDPTARAAAEASTCAFARHMYPHADDSGVRTVCVAGTGASGKRVGLGAGLQACLVEYLARSSYGFNAAWVGHEDVDMGAHPGGDMVIPVETALLPRAETLFLPGVFHQPKFVVDAPGPWYGDPEVVDKWDVFLR